MKKTITIISSVIFMLLIVAAIINISNFRTSDTQDFIMEKDDDEFMSIRCFYRAYDTKDKVIEIPGYIHDQEYEWWK